MNNTLKFILAILIVCTGNVIIGNFDGWIQLIGYCINGGLVGHLVGSS